MRFRLLLVSAIMVLGSLSLTASATAAAQTTRTPFSYYLAFGDGCTHQPGTLTGTLQTTFVFSTDARGNLHIVSRSSYANASFTTDSGSTYRLTSVGGTTQQLINPTAGFPFTLESNFAFNLVGADGQFHGTGIFVFMVNGIGDVTVSFSRVSEDCSP
jgi:hypothetical protein